MKQIKVKVNDQIFEVEIENLHSRPILAKVDGEIFEVQLQEDHLQAVPAAGMQAEPAAAPAAAPKPTAPAGTAGANAITAPIPGVITAIKVKVGDQVSAGDELCNLEAMKMNNAIRTTKPGKVSAIHVNPGDHVQHGQALFDLAG